MKPLHLALGAAILGILLVSLFPRLAAPQRRESRRRIKLLGWVVDYDRGSEKAFLEHRGLFTWVSPTWLTVHGDGYVQEKVWAPALVDAAREAGVKVVVLAANTGFSPRAVHSILTEPAARERALHGLAEIVEKRGYDGLNLDFEGIPPADRDAYTSFVCSLAERLHAAGKELSVDVPAKTSDAGSDWSAAYDYAALARCADYVVVMIYDYHWAGGSPGPISPLPWFRAVLRYAASRIPPGKLVAGIPVYGYDWPRGGRGRGVTYAEAVELARRHGVEPRFDPASGEATFTYTESGVEHTVWFNTAESARLRIGEALAAGVDKIAYWRVGAEDPGFWSAVEEYERG